MSQIFGMSPPVGRGANREPIWPVGCVGSITHCEGYCAAVAASHRSFSAIGIDVEPAERLPAKVESMVCTAAERREIQALSRPGLPLDRIIFSAKESVFKAWYPLAGRWLDFEDVEVSFSLADHRFAARFLRGGPTVAGRRLNQFLGSYNVSDGFIATAVVVGPNHRQLAHAQPQFPDLH